MNQATSFTVTLPEWAVQEAKKLPPIIKPVQERMAIVNRFAKLNVQHNTGGPFAAGVFEEGTGKLVSMGVNRVVPTSCSSAHAEVVALSLAQQTLGGFDLGEKGMPAHELVVNWCPCAMCYGAVLWSGVRSVVIAGAGQEVEEITGFDEGPLHPDWIHELEKRGIKVSLGIGKDDSIEVFKYFRDSGNLVYNGRGGEPNAEN